MKTILLPTDFSQNARYAAEYAFTLFPEKNNRFILLHVYDPPKPTGMLITIDDIVKKEAVTELKTAVTALKQNCPQGSTLEQLVIRGDTTEVINRICSNEKVDLVIMGTKGASGLKEVFMGSTTSTTIKNTNITLLAIHELANKTRPQRILFAADYTHLDKLDVLNPLVELAKKNAASLFIVNVVTNNKGKVSFNPVMEKVALSNYLDNIPHQYFTIENTDVEEGLNSFIEEHQVDLMTVIPGKNNFFDSIFHRSVTNKIALHGKTPLLVLKD
jgi:nucleotide-binding universal stress UspA family protein